MSEVALLSQRSVVDRRKLTPALAIVFVACVSTSCNTAQQIGAGAVAVGGLTPGQEIEQVYYLGVLDPMEQLPTSLYRVHVRGEASLISKTKFASGWVPSEAVDSLTVTPAFGPGGGVTIDRSGEREARKNLALAQSALAAAAKERSELDSDIAKLQKQADDADKAAVESDARMTTLRGEVVAVGGAVVSDALTAAITAVRAKATPSDKPLGGKVADALVGALEGAPRDSGKLAEAETGIANRQAAISDAAKTPGASIKFRDDVVAALQPDPSAASKVGASIAASASLGASPWQRAIPQICEAARGKFVERLRDGVADAAGAEAESAAGAYYAAFAAADLAKLKSKLRELAVAAMKQPAIVALLDTAADSFSAAVRADLTARAQGRSFDDPAVAARSTAATARAEVKAKQPKLKDAEIAQTAAEARAAAEKAIVDAEKTGTGFSVGRRLVLFGPEGFRESPANHRLVILMGTTPEDFFNAASGAITQADRVTAADESAKIATAMRNAMGSIAASSDRLAEIERRAGADLGK